MRLHAARQLLDVIEEGHLLAVQVRAVEALVAVQEGCRHAGVAAAVLEAFRVLAQETSSGAALGSNGRAMALVRSLLLQAVQLQHQQTLLLSAEVHLLLSAIDGVRRELVGEVGMAYLLDLISTPKEGVPLEVRDMLLEAVVNLALDPWCAAELYDHTNGVRMLLAQASLPCQSSLRVSALMALLNIANLGATARAQMVEDGALPVLLDRIRDQEGGPSRRFAAEVLHALIVDESIATAVMEEDSGVVAGLSRVLFTNQALKSKNVRLLCSLVGRLGNVPSTRRIAEAALNTSLCEALEEDASTASCMHIARCIHATEEAWMLDTIKASSRGQDLLREAATARQQDAGEVTKELLCKSLHQTELDTDWVLLGSKKE